MGHIHFATLGHEMHREALSVKDGQVLTMHLCNLLALKRQPRTLIFHMRPLELLSFIKGGNMGMRQSK